MQLYIGVDFHPHQQTVCWLDSATGEMKTCQLQHNLEQVRQFYQAFPSAIVGIEASTNAVWFEQMLAHAGHHLLVGNPALIRARARSRHKSDKRDAELIFDLLWKGEFPALWRRPAQSTQVLEILKTRVDLVGQRTQTYNRLQALAHAVGLVKGKMKTLAFQQQLRGCEVNPAQELQRSQWFALLKQLNEQIHQLETWLESQAAGDKSVQLLKTQKGVGSLTALCVVHTLGDVSRFTRLSKQVAAFAGLDPVERSSAGKRQFGGISKRGSSLLRFLLGQAANIAARSDSRLKSFEKRLSKKKAKSVAKTAVSRKLLIKLAIMLRDNITAQEFEKRGGALGNARVCTRSEMTAD